MQNSKEERDVSSSPKEASPKGSDPSSVKKEDRQTKIKEKKKKISALDLFRETFEKEENVEEKLKASIEFMRNAISQNNAPRFKDFWEAKKLCLPLFKEKINPILKAKFWTEYTELSTEAKRLKEILDEQSSFSMEQLELALKAMESEVDQHEKLVQSLPKLKFPEHSETLVKNLSAYDEMQRHIQYYMTLAARIKDLRREIIATEMRIRHKNKLLKKLTDLGDRFIPEKKQRIKEMSESFISDVKMFADKYFDLDKKIIKDKDATLFKLREEIKSFQSAAKLLSLNSHSFSESRNYLSECWECVRSADKERKKSFADKKESLKKNLEEAARLVEEFRKNLLEEPLKSKESVFERASELSKKLREIKLLKEDVKHFRLEIKKIQDEAIEPFETKEREQEEIRSERAKKREEDLSSFKDLCYRMVRESSKCSLKEMQDFYEEFNQRKKELKPSDIEKSILSELKRELYESILLKRESEISDFDDQKEEAEKLFSDWENFKEETRSRLEAYRKELGSSGFDFEKAMIFSERIDMEKNRLDRAIEKVELLEEILGL